MRGGGALILPDIGLKINISENISTGPAMVAGGGGRGWGWKGGGRIEVGLRERRGVFIIIFIKDLYYD